jgi:hypothetical protein
MAYRPTAAVAQAIGRSSVEPVRNASSVRVCPTVTALPPARAGIARGRWDTMVATNATVATMSRSRTAPIS